MTSHYDTFICRVVFWILAIISLKINVLEGTRKLYGLSVDYEPSCVSVCEEQPDVAVGGAFDNKVGPITATLRKYPR